MPSDLQVDNIKDGSATKTLATLSSSAVTLSTDVTVPASIGGSMHLIQKQTASSDSLIEFTNLNNHSSFNDLHFVFTNIVPTADGEEFLSQIKVSGDTNYKTTNYLYVDTRQYNNGSGSLGTDNNGNTGHLIIIPYTGNDGLLSGYATIHGHQKTDNKKSCTGQIVARTNTNYINVFNFGSFYDGNNNAFTSIKFYIDNSSTISSGSITMYGIKDA
jgi:hypothetical protein